MAILSILDTAAKNVSSLTIIKLISSFQLAIRHCPMFYYIIMDNGIKTIWLYIQSLRMIRPTKPLKYFICYRFICDTYSSSKPFLSLVTLH